MSLLTVVQNVVGELALATDASQITTVIGSGTPLLLRMAALANREVKALRARGSDQPWQALRRESTFATVNGQQAYVRPVDWEYPIGETWYNRTKRWPLAGPLSPAQWQFLQAQVVVGARQGYIERGNLVLIAPTPTSAETIAREYATNLAVLPQTWGAGTTYAPLAAVSWALGITGFNCYTTTGGGVSGSTPPTHTSGSVSDGGVTWTWASTGQETYQRDTDYCLVEEKLVELGMRWRWLDSVNMDYSEAFREWDRECDKALGRDGGRAVLYAGDNDRYYHLPNLIVQDGDWPSS